MGWFRKLRDVNKPRLVQKSNLLISDFIRFKGSRKESARIKLLDFLRRVRAHLNELQLLATEIERLDTKIKAGMARLENIRTHPYGFSEDKVLQAQRDYYSVKDSIDKLSDRARSLSYKLRLCTNRCGINDAVDILKRIEAVLKSN
ncbi:hypothetical protein HOF78_03480 [Candidatus Woesearchaeota archaeon]|nr:hypothetical protein [Candidatus Woesearchaeota archaeon]MBT6044522.1 hypothetical protein [Candidatus Woesearchaeota archaeon]